MQFWIKDNPTDSIVLNNGFHTREEGDIHLQEHKFLFDRTYLASTFIASLPQVGGGEEKNKIDEATLWTIFDPK